MTIQIKESKDSNLPKNGKIRQPIVPHTGHLGHLELITDNKIFYL